MAASAELQSFALRLDHLLQDRHQRGGRHAEHQHAAARFERPQEFPGLAHDEVAVAQRGEIHRGVVRGLVQLIELAQHHEQHPPERNLHDRAQHHHQHDDEQRAQPEGGAGCSLRSDRLPDEIANAPERKRHLHTHAHQYERKPDQQVPDHHVAFSIGSTWDALDRDLDSRQRSSAQTVAHAYAATATYRLVRTAEACRTLLPLALSSIAGPTSISAVISALLQKDGRKPVRRAPNIAEPHHRALAISHSASIQRLGSNDSPNQTQAPTSAPIKVDPTSSFPAERAVVSPACWPSVTVFMMAAR